MAKLIFIVLLITKGNFWASANASELKLKKESVQRLRLVGGGYRVEIRPSAEQKGEFRLIYPPSFFESDAIEYAVEAGDLTLKPMANADVPSSPLILEGDLPELELFGKDLRVRALAGLRSPIKISTQRLDGDFAGLLAPSEIYFSSGKALLRWDSSEGASPVEISHTLRSGQGRVEVLGARSVKLDIRSHEGPILVRDSEFAELSVVTYSGPVECQKSKGRVQIRTFSGEVLAPTCGGSVTVKTNDGGIKATALSGSSYNFRSEIGRIQMRALSSVGVRAFLLSDSGTLSVPKGSVRGLSGSNVTQSFKLLSSDQPAQVRAQTASGSIGLVIDRN